MNKLFKSVHSMTNSGTNNVIKESLTTQLSSSVKEIQYCGIEDKTEDISEALNQLCTIIEAIFLHGLKDSLGRRFRKAIADVDERPEPSFWGPLLVISHRQIIDQITHLSQITTEVGQCRAWVRLALNDCLLSSYLMTMRRDPGVLKAFYKPSAYVRDSELVDVAQRLIEGVEAFKAFKIPSNSSLLNTWPIPSLFLAGVWSPTLKACPVAPCDDVAQSLDDPNRPSIADSTSETCSLSSAMSITSQSSGFRQMGALSEDDALRIILGKPRTIEIDAIPDDSDNVIGNSLNRRTGWSFDETQGKSSSDQAEAPKSSKGREMQEPKSMEASYNAVIESYNMLSGGCIKTPNLNDVWQKFQEQRVIESDNNNVNPPIDANPTENVPVTLSKSESTSMSALIGRISREHGLDNQNYECAGCSEALRFTSKPNVCAFTSEYFCDDCMSLQALPIPARIIHNWDFKLHHVSQKAFNYINEIKDHPIVDFKSLNVFIYGAVEEMANLQILREQLNYLRAYLYTCREPIIEELQKKMWPREYMYEHVHQYSFSDLLEIPNGILAQHLQSVIDFGKDHVLGCWLCSQKGFLCEVCDRPKALFPFDMENIYKCEVCNAVYHKGCLNSSKPCPKCKRRREREDLPLLGATIE